MDRCLCGTGIIIFEEPGSEPGGGLNLKILVIIPIDTYHGFLRKLPIVSREYKILKNGLIIDHPQHGKAVKFVCEIVHAIDLVGRAKLMYPDAAPYIEESIRVARVP
jgi:hypothetical protein